MVQVYSVNDIITLTLLYLLPQYERIPYERLTRVSADGRILVNCHLALAISSYRLLNMFAFEIRSYISIDKCMNIISIYPSRMISIALTQLHSMMYEQRPGDMLSPTPRGSERGAEEYKKKYPTYIHTSISTASLSLMNDSRRCCLVLTINSHNYR